MTTIKQALQNLKNNGPGYYPCLVGGKLHINRDENWEVTHRRAYKTLLPLKCL